MKILKPKTGHGGDTFRELLDMWEENGYCEIEETDSNFCWVGERGKVLLYDFPRLDDRKQERFEIGLFGNTVPDCGGCSPWIFWPRKPRVVEEHRKELVETRTIESVFLGKIENDIQLHNRSQCRWDTSVELFSMPKLMHRHASNTNYPYTQEEYLNIIKRSSYGLCLPGYGPKCNREIEYMAFGTVPIITTGVDVSYYDALVEGEHYIRVDTPEEISPKIRSISKEKWRQMSDNCVQWYERNASPKGSFETTVRILKNEFNYRTV